MCDRLALFFALLLVYHKHTCYQEVTYSLLTQRVEKRLMLFSSYAMCLVSTSTTDVHLRILSRKYIFPGAGGGFSRVHVIFYFQQETLRASTLHTRNGTVLCKAWPSKCSTQIFFFSNLVLAPSTSLFPLLLSPCLPFSFNFFFQHFHFFHISRSQSFLHAKLNILAIDFHILWVDLLCLPTFSSWQCSIAFF